MILILCFILLVSCFIEIDRDVCHQSHSIDYDYKLNIWPFSNLSFLTIFRDELDEEVYCLSFQIDFGFIKYKEEVDKYYKDYIGYVLYKTGYYNLYYEYNFIINNEFYNKYLREE